MGEALAPSGGPLEGLLVVSIDQAVAAPFCAARLADDGARVIKVERPGGDFARAYDRTVDGESTYFVWLNRGKESIVIDFRDAQDAALLKRMIDGADVFLHNLGPGAAERAGLGAAALLARNPRLVACAITGYGDGPYRERKAYDLLIQAESGLCSVTGTPDAPGRVGVSVVDIATGMYAHAAIVTALFARERTGRGRALEVSMFDAMAEWMTVPLLHTEYTGRPPGRPGVAHPAIAPYGVFRAADGLEIVISIQSEREWKRFCEEVLERPDMVADPRYASSADRVANRTELDATVAAIFARYDGEALAARLDGAGIAFGNLNTVDRVLSHPHLKRTTVGTPAGTARLPLPPVRTAGLPTGGLADVPALDQHGAAIRAEFAPAAEETARP